MSEAPPPEAAADTSTARAEAAGGDPACWLAKVCEGCGALNEGPGTTCWRCGIVVEREDG